MPNYATLLSSESTLSVSQDLLISTTKYLNIAGIAIQLYDFLLTLESEITVIWKTRMTIPKAAYVVYRYVMLFDLLFFSMLSIELFVFTDGWCANITTIAAIILFLVDTVGHGLVVFRTFVLWERSTRIIKMLLIVSAIVNVALVALVSLVVRFMRQSAIYIQALHACDFNLDTPYFLVYWAVQIFFDVYVLAIIYWNAIDRPRLLSQRLPNLLYKDGVFLMLTTTALRVMNLTFCAQRNISSSQISTLFVESTIASINARLLLRTFTLESRRPWGFGFRNESEDICL